MKLDRVGAGIQIQVFSLYPLYAVRLPRSAPGPRFTAGSLGWLAEQISNCSHRSAWRAGCGRCPGISITLGTQATIAVRGDICALSIQTVHRSGRPWRWEISRTRVHSELSWPGVWDILWLSWSRSQAYRSCWGSPRKEPGTSGSCQKATAASDEQTLTSYLSRRCEGKLRQFEVPS